MKGEFELIDSIKKMFPVPEGVTGIGDDCAVLPQRDGLQTLVTTDMLLEGVHFLRDDASPYDVGWKSAAVNLSDIAGMGGRPEATFLSFALPADLPESWIDSFMDGYKALSSRFSCPLLGGDSCSSPDKICINVTVLGSCVAGKVHKRSEAAAGDLICTTGPAGDAGAGLKILLETPKENRTELEKRLVQRHYRPVPKLEEGLLLSSLEGVHAMMDISDGIGSDLRHILEMSGVCAEVDTEALPLSRDLMEISGLKGWDPVELALEGGEDYELLFTLAPEREAAIREKMLSRGFGMYTIGKITVQSKECKIVWNGSGRDYDGFKHFQDK